MARTYERPCASLKYEPTTTGSAPMALKATLMGLLPVWSRSFLPGAPTYLQTNALCGASAADTALAPPARLRA